jgi:hypothetical protein
MTGKHVLESAMQLGERAKVAVFVRNADKVPAQFRDKVEIVKGDVTDVNAVKACVISLKPDAIIVTTTVGKTNNLVALNQLVVPELVNALSEDGRLNACKIIYLSGAFSPNPPDESYGCFFSCLMNCFNLKGQVYDNSAVMRYLFTSSADLSYTVVKMGGVGEKPSKGRIAGKKCATGEMGASVTFTDVGVFLVAIAMGDANHSRETIVMEYATA